VSARTNPPLPNQASQFGPTARSHARSFPERMKIHEDKSATVSAKSKTKSQRKMTRSKDDA